VLRRRHLPAPRLCGQCLRPCRLLPARREPASWTCSNAATRFLATTSRRAVVQKTCGSPAFCVASPGSAGTGELSRHPSARTAVPATALCHVLDAGVLCPADGPASSGPSIRSHTARAAASSSRASDDASIRRAAIKVRALGTPTVDPVSRAAATRASPPPPTRTATSFPTVRQLPSRRERAAGRHRS
jgi:hypothetical protein